MDRMVKCLTLYDVALVPHAKAMLDSVGIPYFVKNDAVQNLVGWGTLGGFNPIVGAPVVMVPESSLEQARALLAELEGGEPQVTSRAAFCTQCNRSLVTDDEDDEGLTHCFHCGSPLASEP